MEFLLVTVPYFSGNRKNGKLINCQYCTLKSVKEKE